MYDSVNLPLSRLKILKKTIAHPIFWLWVLVGGMRLPALAFLFGPLIGGIIDNVLFLFNLIPIAAILIYECLYYKLYYYNFRDDEAEIQKGVVGRAKGMVRYERLQNVYVDQDILDRIFGLYDVHFETAGETSGFYSHVDGLNKENSDKLVAFLTQAARTSTVAQPSTEVSLRSAPARVAYNTPVQGAPAFPIISRENCPLSPSVVLASALEATFALLLIFIPILTWILWNTKINKAFIIAPGSVALVGMAYAYFSVWYQNFNFKFGPEQGEIVSRVIGQSINYLYYDRIQNVNINQGIFERLFGIYTVRVETAGEVSGMRLVIPGLPMQSAEALKNFLLAKSRFYRGRL